MPPDPGPYPEDQPLRNSVRFTPAQVAAILSGLQPGLTLLVGRVDACPPLPLRR